jgi:hypothetical protein
LKWERDDVCSVCCGTEFSGPSLLCEKCNIVETHFQCLKNPIFYVPKGKYYCDGCCKILKINPGTIVADEEVGEDIISSNGNFDIKIDNKNNGRGGRSGGRGGPGSRGRGRGNSGRGRIKTTSNNDDEFQVTSAPSLFNKNSQADDDYTAIESEEDEEDEKCFVCGENGSLVLCDFPNCRRVYHHVSTI